MSDDERRQRVVSAAVRMGLAERIPGARATELLDLGIQDPSPGAAVTALAARCDGRPELGNTTVAWTLRGAPHVIRGADLGWWMAALRPLDGDDLAARLYDYGSRLLKAGHDPLEGLEQTATAMRWVIARGPLPRSELSTEVTKLVDEQYRPYCTSCRVAHVQEDLFRFGALQAGVEVTSDSRPIMLRQADTRGGGHPPAAARRRLVRRFVAVAEPARPEDLAGWLGTDADAARRIWEAAGGDRALQRRPDHDAAAMEGVRLLPPNDPLLRLVDRSLVVPDTSRRKELFRPTGGPGALLVDGDVAGTWRARSTRKALSVSVDPWHRLADHQWDALRLEAERLAEARNAAAAPVNRLD
jgi:Winged helix DNA-binding domain